MNTRYSKQLIPFAIAAAVTLTSLAQADPLPGRDKLKFSQLPIDKMALTAPNGTTATFYGHDELSTAYSFPTTAGTPSPYRGTFMADDFADKFSSPIVHIKWWGSYLDNGINPNLPINKFLISIESDVPQTSANPFSHPGTPLLSQVVKRGPISVASGTFTEKPISPGGAPLNEHLYEYNAELNLGQSFFQKPDTVYWLKIVALVDAPAGVAFNPLNPPAFVPRWGWHDRDYTLMDPLASTPPAVSPGEFVQGLLGPAPGGIPVWHFQDDAVTGQTLIDLNTPTGVPQVVQTGYQPTLYKGGGIDGPNAIGQMSKDLAFQLFTTVPEPTTCLLSAAAFAMTLAASRRQRH
jgi:hypothetical protein